MWTDHYLKFDNEAAWLAAIPTEWQGEDGPVMASTQHALDVVGVIIRGDTGEPTQGWHINVRLYNTPLPAALAAAEVPPPQNPKRLFA